MIEDGKLEGKFSLVLYKSPFRRKSGRADLAFLSPRIGGFEPLTGLTMSPIENTSSLVFCAIPFSSSSIFDHTIQSAEWDLPFFYCVRINDE